MQLHQTGLNILTIGFELGAEFGRFVSISSVSFDANDLGICKIRLQESSEPFGKSVLIVAETDDLWLVGVEAFVGIAFVADFYDI